MSVAEAEAVLLYNVVLVIGIGFHDVQMNKGPSLRVGSRPCRPVIIFLYSVISS